MYKTGNVRTKPEIFATIFNLRHDSKKQHDISINKIIVPADSHGFHEGL